MWTTNEGVAGTILNMLSGFKYTYSKYKRLKVIDIKLIKSKLYISCVVFL